ncbi:flagellar biosynthesis protein FlhF [Polynucleobacter sp. MG-5-Ahmo-C2]|jgi:flagellar biosynthesis protein FlhF|uniref:flagellar biosynthesis protein FlhF n=1 Tax=Polynucleobacter sp. MG-5-Ahmo-C2 TaxID=2081051 RepID=UPI001BFDCC5C|nr:flagellar biosynthesis protein FlhF [Polynucleobacter sp. MG-5-Ahmo-C2]QWD97846.1 flagellar biosynthesis protein FlhF [Polynucleobacter sp. MG-5-Ahmo-C2]
MTMKKFLAKTTRQALMQVKAELGEDATIISNRSINGWTEILARSESIALPGSRLLDSAMTSKQQAEKALQAKKVQETVDLLNGRSTHKAITPKTASSSTEIMAAQEQPVEIINHPQIQGMLKEMREMRNQFQAQLEALSNSTLEFSPNKRDLMSQFLSAGFNLDLAKRVIGKLPSDFSAKEAKPWAMNLLAKNMQVLENEAEIMNQHGIYALLGPTGVGKTTTIAKIASRFVLKHGNQDIALVSTDTYRIGGHEQLRIYGKILGVEVFAAKDAQELQQTLEKLQDKKLILIDMAGLSQKDKMVNSQLDMLCEASHDIKKIICLNASGTLDTLNNVSKTFAGRGLDGCIITKADEAIGLGGVINAVLQNKLKVLYLTNGQRVPEDITLVDKITLIEAAFKPEDSDDHLSIVRPEDLPAFFSKSVVTEQGHAQYA